jgi:hypothetical protein
MHKQGRRLHTAGWPECHSIKTADSASGFLLMPGTSASSAGNPTGSNRKGFSLAGKAAGDTDGFLHVVVLDFSLLSFRVARNVKRWHGSDQPLRWTATGLLEAERKFRKVKGFRELANLHHKLNPSLTQQVQLA